MRKTIFANVDRKPHQAPGGEFEVFDTATSMTMTTGMGWKAAWEEFDKLHVDGDNLDVRPSTPIPVVGFVGNINPLLLTEFR